MDQVGCKEMTEMESNRDFLKDNASEKKFAYKNLIVVTIVFFLVFTSFNSIQNLQTSINKDPALGFTSLTILYLSFTIPCFFLPNMVIRKVGCKYTMLISMSGYLLYNLANLYSNWWTLSIGSVFAGVAASLFWSTQASYITAIASRYSTFVEDEREKGGIITRFFCIFYFIFQLNQVIGNMISSLVLKQNVTPHNSTNASSTLVCGAAFCPSTPLPSSANDVDRKTVSVLLGIFISVTFCAIVILYLFLDPIKKNCTAKKESNVDAILSTVRLLKDRRILMLIPITVLSGLEEGFLFGDFTKAYVTCSIGIEMVGFVMICFGATCCATSMVLVTIAKQLSILVVMLGGMILHLGLMIAFLYWKIEKSDYIALFASAGVWGVCDAIWQTQIVAFYGIIFHDKRDEAMSISKLWLSLGFIFAFAYGNLLCQEVKIYIFISILLVGMALYGFLEYEWRQFKKMDNVCIEATQRDSDGGLQIENKGYVDTDEKIECQ